MLDKIRYLAVRDCPSSDFTGEQKQLYRAAKAFLDCDEASAESAARALFETAGDPDVKDMAVSILFAILLWQDRFGELARFGIPRGDDDLQALALYNPDNMSVIYGKTPVESDMPAAIDDLPAVRVRINGTDVDLLIDTGAMITTVTESVARKCNILSGSGAIEAKNAMETSFTTQLAAIDELTFGNSTFSNKPCIVIPDSALDFGALSKDHPPINGTAGWEIIKQFKLTVGYKNRRVRIEPSVPGNAARNMCCDFYPMVRLSVNNENVVMGLDTGATGTLLGMGMRPRFGELEQSVQMRGAAGQISEEKKAVIPRLDFTVDNTAAFLENVWIYEDKERSPANVFTLAGVLGSDIGKGKKIIVDFPNRRFEIAD